MVVVATALFVAGAIVTYVQRGWTWVSVGLALTAVVLGGGGILETFLFRVHLADDALEVRDLRGTRRYARASIERIEEAKGVPAAIRLTDGTWVRLPPVGPYIGNSVRAWLKR